MTLTTACRLAVAIATLTGASLSAQERPTPRPKAAPAPNDARRPAPRAERDWSDLSDPLRWSAKFDALGASAEWLSRDAARMASDFSNDALLKWQFNSDDVLQDAKRAMLDSQRDLDRSMRESQREIDQSLRDAQREAARAMRDADREMRDLSFDSGRLAQDLSDGMWRDGFAKDGSPIAMALDAAKGSLGDWTRMDKLWTAPAFDWKGGWDFAPLAPLAPLAPSRWLDSRFPDDPADSLYRQARELLNRGEWRRAAALFRDIPSKFPNSAYAPDAYYWQAFALYRIGGSAELRDAIGVLDAQRGKFPGARTQSDASALATRIRGALAARGDAQAAAQISKTASDSTTRCDQEELAVRIEALSSLSQADPDGAAPILQKVLARRDECSVQLRRNAVFLLVSKKRDAATFAQLTQVARTDPSTEVRAAAVEWMARMPGDEVVGALEELAKSADDERLQRAAVRGLMMNPTPRARAAVRALIERNETPDRVRAEALGNFSSERASSEDAAWLRSLYGKTNDSRMKARIVAAAARVGGSENDQWLLSLARNADEDSEVRGMALRRVSRSLGIPDLAKLYDQSADRISREMLIQALSERAEPEATDKLIDIVKTGTDPQLRRGAISALSRKKDPRTTRLLMEIVDK